MVKKIWKRQIPVRRSLATALVVSLTALSAVFLTRAATGAGTPTPAPPMPVEAPPAACAEPNRVTVLELPMRNTVPAVETLAQPQEPERVARYLAVQMTDEERLELASILFLEAANQCAEGQQAVVEVVLNRVISQDFPNNVHDVLHQGEGTPVPQFSTIGNLALAAPGQAQQGAIDAALHGPSILPADVVYFSREGENDRVWGTIGDHVFCHGYIWD